MPILEVASSSTRELAAFIKSQYDEWKSEESFVDYELWAAFTETFRPVRPEQWTKLNSTNRGVLSQLRSILRTRGVWVDDEAKQDIALFNCALERSRQWSCYEIDLIRESGGTPTYGILLQIENSDRRISQQHTPLSINETKERKPSSNTNENNYSQQPISVQTLTNLAKLYSESVKCTGEQDSFRYKVKIFEEKCSQAVINDDQSKAAAFTMLTGDSLCYFYTLPHSNSYAKICLALSNHFEGPESMLNATKKWNSLNLRNKISSDPR
ncbi:hypothetical protein Golomagni_05043 [Golovinomyces magnicellulatus]|nr:hypothetical protein Golomagni_05043 [Golovinomyces magnicellulatus]